MPGAVFANQVNNERGCVKNRLKRLTNDCEVFNRLTCVPGVSLVETAPGKS